MTIRTQLHGSLSGRWCFKCGEGLSHADGVHYLGHDWCVGCAQGEAKARAPRAAAAQSTNGAGASDTSTPHDIPAGVQSLLKVIPKADVQELRWDLGLPCIAVGLILLVIGLGFVLRAPAVAFTGPTLTLAGAILLAAVVHRR